MSEEQTGAKSKEAEPWLIFLIAVGVIAVGLGFGYYAFSNAKKASYLMEHGIKVKGILESKSRGTGSSDRTYHYKIKYTWEGQELNYETSSKFETHNEGDLVELLINPDDPNEVVINDRLDMNKGSYSWSLIILLIGGGIFWLGLKKVKQK